MLHLCLFVSMSLLADLRGGDSRFAAPGDLHGLAAPASGFAEPGGEGTTVVLLLDGGFDPLTLGAFCSVLGSGQGSETYRLVFASAKGGDLEGSGGLRIATLRACDLDPKPDILLVLGGSDCEPTPHEPLASWLRTAGTRCGRVYAIGWGARLLQALAEPDARSSTDTPNALAAHETPRPADAPVLERHGRVWLSPGHAAAIDVALIIVEEDLGAPRALAMAASLRLSARRAAGDASVGRTLRLQLRSGARFAGLIDAIRNNPTMRADVESLAELSGMSPRTFARRFLRETGVTPATAVETIRLEIAQSLKSSGDLTVKEIAARSGFGSEARLRSATRRCAAASPRPS